MSSLSEFNNQINIVAEVIRRYPKIGRTGVMKCVYFLQEVYGLSLGYRFTMYTYGPYDPDVQSAVNAAINDGYVGYTVRALPHGSAYEYEATNKALDEPVMPEISEALNELAQLFPETTDAKKWELAATIVCVYKANASALKAEVVSGVKGIKPRFSEIEIEKEYDRLVQHQVLK